MLLTQNGMYSIHVILNHYTAQSLMDLKLIYIVTVCELFIYGVLFLDAAYPPTIQPVSIFI